MRNETEKKIVDAAYELSKQIGYDNLTNTRIALKAGVSRANIYNYFDDIRGIKERVVYRAIMAEDLPIIAQAILNNHPCCALIGDLVKREALESLLL